MEEKQLNEEKIEEKRRTNKNLSLFTPLSEVDRDEAKKELEEYLKTYGGNRKKNSKKRRPKTKKNNHKKRKNKKSKRK